MKTCLKTPAICLALVALLTAPSLAAPATAGPNGGKLLGADPDRAELVIDAKGMLTLTFLDKKLKPIPAGPRTVTLIAQLESGRQVIALELKDGIFVSKDPLPQPDGYTLVLQLRPNAEAKPVNFRVPYQMSLCGGCNLREYACTCEHH